MAEDFVLPVERMVNHEGAGALKKGPIPGDVPVHDDVPVELAGQGSILPLAIAVHGKAIGCENAPSNADAGIGGVVGVEAGSSRDAARGLYAIQRGGIAFEGAAGARIHDNATVEP